MKRILRCFGILLLTLVLPAMAAAAPKSIVIVAGKKSHGPEGNGIHDYPWSSRLLKVMLDHSNIAERVAVTFHLDGWPKDTRALEAADAIMIISDGRDGDLYAEAPHLENAERVAFVERQMKRGCGLLTFHFSTFAPDKLAEQSLRWTGGYFDWEEGGIRKWYSAIQTKDAEIALATPQHPVLRGVKPFKMREEFYYNLRFAEGDVRWTPLWTVADLPGRDAGGRVVAWAREREDGGRGFGTTCGHFYDNWQQPHFRKFILNALAWAAKVEVPVGGVEAAYFTREEIRAALAGVSGAQKARAEKTIRALILTGHQYPGHKWQETTPVLRGALEQDGRFAVTVSENIEDLAKLKPGAHDVVLLNYCNWEQPRGLSDAAKAGFVDYLKSGGGLVLVHFANGAWHFSLPKAGESDWPEFRKICRRVWDHKSDSGHDAFGPLHCDITTAKHPITAGLAGFDTIDELYFRQKGEEAIEALVTARSKVTGKDEPLAWTYSYGQGRVFQTVLGHAAVSLQMEGPAELVRRGAVWAAGREQRAVPRQEVKLASTAGSPATAPVSTGPLPAGLLVEGKNGKALDARIAGAMVEGHDDFRVAPLSVTCRARLFGKGSFNILVASQPKSAATHWEMYSYAGSGVFSVFLPGRGGEYRTSVDICDGQWHELRMLMAADRLQLFVDGKPALDKALPPMPASIGSGALAIGQLVEGGVGCDGLIDEVLITKPGADDKVPARLAGSWSFDVLDAGKQFADASPHKRAAVVSAAKAAPANPSVTGTGAADDPTRQTEKDWVDARWAKTDMGPIMSGHIATPHGGTAKGIAIRVGEQGEASVCFDTDLLCYSAGWAGGFLQTDPTRYGLSHPLKLGGEVVFASEARPGWADAKGKFEDSRSPKYGPLPRDWARYRGLHLHGKRVVLASNVDGAEVIESPWAHSRAGVVAISRELEIGARTRVTTLHVCDAAKARVEIREGLSVALAGSDANLLAVVATGAGRLFVDEPGRVRLEFPAGQMPARAKLFFWRGAVADLPKFLALAKEQAAPAELRKWIEPGLARWGAPLVTKGVVDRRKTPFAIDTITVPHENPFRALMFTAGHDFFANGDAAVCTVHGDVWLVRGIDGTLENVRWHRFATGLYQPLGLRIVNDRVHVLGRDQITRLHDANADGEADHYEVFNNDLMISGGGHSYATCLETDAAGNFYFIRCAEGTPHGGVALRVAKDGSKLEVLATGFRNPNGLGVGPDGTVTAADQQGDWVPETRLDVLQPGGFYGFMPMHKRAEAPKTFDAPLCWIPRAVDNSAGGQVWVPRGQWGALDGQMLHLSYGRCTWMMVLRDGPNGAVVPLPGKFLSGVMRGRFNPKDGHLYLTGLRGWQTAAVRDGCFQRVRQTGEPFHLPAATSVHADGIRITFNTALDKAAAQDVENWSLEQWNYRWSSAYGSKDWSVKNPEQSGRDTVTVRRAELSADARSVFLRVEGVQPVHALAIKYNLDTAAGTNFKGDLYLTINKVGAVAQ